MTADLGYVPPGRKPSKGAWQLVLLDDRSIDCGYHDLTDEGLPLGKVFVKEASACPSGWTSTASHELLELLANPDTTFGVMVEDRSAGQRVYSYEVCDACQDDRFTYEIDGQAMSDFVYPAWFEPWHAARSTRFDHAGHLRRPFEVPRGCYASFFDVAKKAWLDNAGGKETPRLNVYGVNDRDRGGSRRTLRGKPRGEWEKSRPREKARVAKPSRPGKKASPRS
jgi:hypothetical protein